MSSTWVLCIIAIGIAVTVAMITRTALRRTRSEPFQDAEIDPIYTIMTPTEEDLYQVDIPRPLAVKAYELLGPSGPSTLFGPTGPLGETAPALPAGTKSWPSYPAGPRLSSPAAPAQIREILLSDMGFYTDLFNRISIPQQQRNADWQVNVGRKSCDELARLATEFRQMITDLQPKMTDISGAASGYVEYKTKNLAYQRELENQCKRNMSEACIQLAKLDESILPLMPEFEKTNVDIVEKTVDFTERYTIIEQLRQLLECPVPFGINPDMTDGKNLGFIDTVAVRNKLSELSPYYISPDVLNYITQYLVKQEELDSKRNTTQEMITELKGYSTQMKAAIL